MAQEGHCLPGEPPPAHCSHTAHCQCSSLSFGCISTHCLAPRCSASTAFYISLSEMSSPKHVRCAQHYIAGFCPSQACFLDCHLWLLAGEVLFGTDSHTCNAGAFGQFASGIGNTDAGFIPGTGKLLIKVPPSIRFVLEGEMPPYLLAKDLILQIIGEITVAGTTSERPHELVHQIVRIVTLASHVSYTSKYPQAVCARYSWSLTGRACTVYYCSESGSKVLSPGVEHFIVMIYVTYCCQ